MASQKDSSDELLITHDDTQIYESRMHIKIEPKPDSDLDSEEEHMLQEDPADHVDIPVHSITDAMHNATGRGEDAKKALAHIRSQWKA